MRSDLLTTSKSKLSGWLYVWGPALLLSLLALAATPWLVRPACPKRVVIATGSKEGAYYAFAQRYREILARQGVTLEVRATAGSIENFELLSDPDSDVMLAITQGGTAPAELTGQVESLASLYLEPIWIFYRGEGELERVTQLAGKRIAVGSPGSGTKAVALKLLAENDLATASETEPRTSTVDLGGSAAAAALEHGEVDAACFVISPRSEIVRKLLVTEGIHLLSFRRAAAYGRMYPYLSSVTLAEGLLDLKRNIPHRDIVLLAPTANLVARSDLHPALVPLLLGAVNEVHEPGGFLEQPGAFPSPQHVDYPLRNEAQRYFKSGPSLLYRWLPFLVAAWLDRMKMLLLPLVTLLLPLVKAAPPLYRWRIRRKIYRWYRVLREIDQKLKTAGPETDFCEDIATLRRLEHELAEVSVPLSYMEEFYNLRLHVSFVLGRLEKPQWSHRAQAA